MEQKKERWKRLQGAMTGANTREYTDMRWINEHKRGLEKWKE